jgi:hypothetical protein
MWALTQVKWESESASASGDDIRTVAKCNGAVQRNVGSNTDITGNGHSALGANGVNAFPIDAEGDAVPQHRQHAPAAIERAPRLMLDEQTQQCRTNTFAA